MRAPKVAPNSLLPGPLRNGPWLPERQVGLVIAAVRKLEGVRGARWQEAGSSKAFAQALQKRGFEGYREPNTGSRGFKCIRLMA